jgi:1-acyl-sn-glycerol-3-phosphate acyltransferase
VGSTNPARPRGYPLLKTLAWILMKVFLRRCDLTGADRLVEGRPTIIAANHSQGLADPILMAARLPGLPRFLAASYLWKIPPARFLFWLAEVVPVYRRRDGSDTANNKEAFSACNDVLAEGAHIMIFPEGEVHREPSMIPLKTGAARIALGAAAPPVDIRGLTIVPVGLVWDDKARFRSQAAVHVGKPIVVDDWVDRYQADEQETVRALTDALADHLRDVTLNHSSWHQATVIDRAAAITILGERSPGPREPVFAERTALHRALLGAIEAQGGEDGEAFRRLADAVEAYRRDLALLGVDNPRAVPRLQPGWIRLRIARLAIGSSLLMPFAAVGILLDGPVVLAVNLVKTRVHHPAWQLTAKGLTGFVLFPILWATETTMAYRRFGGKVALAVAAAGPIGGIGWIAWRARWLRWRRSVASLEWFGRPDAALEAARASREEVIQQVGALVGEPAMARARVLA